MFDFEEIGRLFFEGAKVQKKCCMSDGQNEKKATLRPPVMVVFSLLSFPLAGMEWRCKFTGGG